MEEQTALAYEVRLDAFTGPLDLLLHLIRKHEIDIYDIPIALITQQYLESLQTMKALNLSLAGEFLVMAATLIHIKSRMLLPKEEAPDPGEPEGNDPRSELVRRLVREVFADDAVTIVDLLDALQDVLTRTEAAAGFDVTPDTITVQDRINGVIERLEETPTLTFTALFEGATSRMMVIVTFLALLELVRMKLVRVAQRDVFGTIRITRAFLAGQETSPENHMTNGGSGGNTSP